MLPVDVIAVGKLSDRFAADGWKEYEKRLSAHCKLTLHELREQQARNEADIPRALAAEGDDMLRRLRDGAFVIAMCVEGEELASEQFAATIGRCRDAGTPVTLLVGGSRGLSDVVKRRADLCLSFGRMTMPHQLFRLVLIEQLYRAFMILSSAKYHK